jgi:hypothetical protein
MPSLIREPLIHPLTQAVTSMLTKLPTDETGSSDSLGAPNARLVLVLSLSVYSSHAVVIGLRVIAPAMVLLLFTQKRKRA